MTARWQNIVVATYAVPPGMLAPYLPPGPDGRPLELDTRPEFVRGGVRQALVSLVALQMRSVRVLGIPWPGLRSFNQINFRVYVRHQSWRGVVFIRQISSGRVPAWGVRTALNGPAVAAPIASEVKQHHRTMGVEYRLAWPRAGLPAGGSAFGKATQGQPFEEQLIRVIGSKPVIRPHPDAIEHWLTKREWGFGLDAKGAPTVHEVIHPAWGFYPVIETDIRVDFASVFGVDWGFLSDQPPVSTLLGVGSEATVFPSQSTLGVRWSVRKDDRPRRSTTRVTERAYRKTPGRE